MEILLTLNKKKRRIKFRGKIIGLLKKMKINRESVVVIKNGKVVPEGDEIKAGDKIEVIQIASGG